VLWGDKSVERQCADCNVTFRCSSRPEPGLQFRCAACRRARARLKRQQRLGVVIKPRQLKTPGSAASTAEVLPEYGRYRLAGLSSVDQPIRPAVEDDARRGDGPVRVLVRDGKPLSARGKELMERMNKDKK
jgi:hypothetical protein